MMTAYEEDPTPAAPMLSRNVIVTISVIAFHVIALWLLQTGLLRRAVELVVPAQVIAEFIEPPRPRDEPPPPPPPEPDRKSTRLNSSHRH